MTQDSSKNEFRDEDDEYDFSTFKNRIRFLDGKWYVEDKYKSIRVDIENLSVARVFFGDYTDEYILEIKKRLPLLSMELDNEIKKKKFPLEKFKNFERLRHETEKIVFDRAKNIESVDKEMDLKNSKKAKSFKTHVKNNWKEEEDVEQFIKLMRKEFCYVKDNYLKNKGRKGSKQDLFLLTYALLDENIISESQQQYQIETVKKFLIEEDVDKSDVSGYNRVNKDYSNSKNYEKIEKKLKSLIDSDLKLKINRLKN